MDVNDDALGSQALGPGKTLSCWRSGNVSIAVPILRSASCLSLLVSLLKEKIICEPEIKSSTMFSHYISAEGEVTNQHINLILFSFCKFTLAQQKENSL